MTSYDIIELLRDYEFSDKVMKSNIILEIKFKTMTHNF